MCWIYDLVQPNEDAQTFTKNCVYAMNFYFDPFFINVVHFSVNSQFFLSRSLPLCLPPSHYCHRDASVCVSSNEICLVYGGAMVNTAWMSYRYANCLNCYTLTNVCREKLPWWNVFRTMLGVCRTKPKWRCNDSYAGNMIQEYP